MTDYDRIAKVIRYLDDNRIQQPSLEELAGLVSLSPSNFQRLFSIWAGIEPNEFLQCLTLAHTRKLLSEGRGMLDTALGSGIPCSGRLHNPWIQLGVATPAEIKAGGKGWIISAGYSDTPFGTCLIAQNPRGICHLSFVEESQIFDACNELMSNWPNAHMERDDQAAETLCRTIFDQKLCFDQPLKVYVQGTAFQLRVWKALINIPKGVLVSYGSLAEMAGKPSSIRAIGTAIGRNSLAYLVPCHRVIRSTGAMGGYRWGITRKKAIQVWESSPVFRSSGC